MRFFEVVLIAVSLAMDAFAVALGAGTRERTQKIRAAVRLSFHFGLFQFLMPVIGWLAGRRMETLIKTFDHWVAFGLLAFVGGHMAYESLQPVAGQHPADPTRGMRMVVLSLATSIDALAVGLSLGILHISVWYPSVVIGVVTAAMSLLGVYLGDRLRSGWGRRMELVGAVILVLTGLRILLTDISR